MRISFDNIEKPKYECLNCDNINEIEMNNFLHNKITFHSSVINMDF